MVNNLRKKDPGLLQQIKMVAVNHHLACDMVQPRTPASISGQEASRSRLPHTSSAGVRSGENRRASRSDSAQ
jgi:hypothetical protein